VALVLFVVVICAGCDQAAKSAARELLPPSESVSLLDDAILFHYAENTGAFLGLGSGLAEGPAFLILVVFTSAAVLVALVIALSGRLDLTGSLALALFCGGGIGNLIDRVLNDGAVIDFVRLRLGPLRTGVFNLADVAIVAGAILLALWSVGEETAESG
jgi:signal peptidase II